jgi:hypothetical protein
MMSTVSIHPTDLDAFASSIPFAKEIGKFFALTELDLLN